MIKLIVLDIDRTLTDGGIAYDGKLKIESFSVKDGLMLKMLPNVGVPVLLLAGRESEAVRRRVAEMSGGLIENTADIESVLERILVQRGLKFTDVAYIGGSLNDFEALRRCGFKACPSDASEKGQALADYISPYPGGHGAVYDVCEKLLQEAGLHEACEKLLQEAGLHEACEKLLQASDADEAYLRMFQAF
jgi:3-deoxy-D-manno-octulosonate 8-phosphate phosphatase (KDO 8-P phosphatase)